jgi:endonuclease III
MKKLSRKDRYDAVFTWFEKNNPAPETELMYKNPYELIVAVILSAQCTDVRVNLITPEFFRVFPDSCALARASHGQVYNVIKSCSYPNNKSRNLISMAQMLIDQFGNTVPDEVDELQKLPGVGRKTANVIVSVAFGKSAMAVDTHVFRVSARIGLTRNAKTPLAAEKQLVRFIPEAKIRLAHHWLILHGRYVCKARKPLCSSCGISDYCAYFKTKAKSGSQRKKI